MDKQENTVTAGAIEESDAEKDSAGKDSAKSMNESPHAGLTQRTGPSDDRILAAAGDQRNAIHEESDMFDVDSFANPMSHTGLADLSEEHVRYSFA